MNKGQLRIKDIVNCYVKLREKGMTEKEVLELPIYLGDDDELNGIHCGWYCEMFNKEDKDDDSKYIIKLIEDRNGAVEDKFILIS